MNNLIVYIWWNRRHASVIIFDIYVNIKCNNYWIHGNLKLIIIIFKTGKRGEYVLVQHKES